MRDRTTKSKPDYKSIALFELAKQHHKKTDEYAEELKEHNSDVKDFEDWVWEGIINNWTYKELSGKILELKKSEKGHERHN